MDIARLNIRPATGADLPGLYEIADRAVRSRLTARYYTRRQVTAVEASQGHHVEPELIEDGTYYLVEVDGVPVGGSGWSPRSGFHPPMVGGAEAEVHQARGIAAMRASYVEPVWAGHGLGTLLARTTEAAARLSGYTSFEAMCTPGSEAMRLRLGYRLLRRVDVPLIDGVTISMAHLRKDSDNDVDDFRCDPPMLAESRR